MQHSLIKLQDYKQMLWKNGKGFTYEIAKDSEDDQYGWRISMAEIKENGPFSNFDGYQRIISVLEGDGIQLAVDEQEAKQMTQFGTFAFNGASQTHCTLIKNIVKDFNLIYKPEVYRSRFQWLDVSQTQTFCSQAETILLFSAADAIEIQTSTLSEQLNCYDSLLMTQNNELIQFDLSAKTSENKLCCVIELSKI